MDDYMFRAHVAGCRKVVEETSYLDIFNYSVRSVLENIDPLINGRYCIRIRLSTPSPSTGSRSMISTTTSTNG